MPLNAVVRSQTDLARVVAAEGGGPYYVYVLRQPSAGASLGTPFYVGVGQGSRLFSHEEEARVLGATSAKVNAIRAIWAAGGEVVRTVDSVHQSEPWGREEALINQLGRIADGTGPLTNAQVYAKSTKVDGVELRKYARNYAVTEDVDAIPPSFKLGTKRLMAGPVQPNNPSTVMGKVYATAAANPGITGTELIGLLSALDYKGNKSAYTQSGKVSASWLAGYIEGAYFRKDKLHLQDFVPTRASRP